MKLSGVLSAQTQIINVPVARTSLVSTVSVGGGSVGRPTHETHVYMIYVEPAQAIHQKFKDLNISVAIAREAIIALIKARDFLGYQLSFANGAMTEAQLNVYADEYLNYEVDKDIETIARKTACLSMLLGAEHCVLVDAELVSTLFKCELDVAEASLFKAASLLDEKRSLSLPATVSDI